MLILNLKFILVSLILVPVLHKSPILNFMNKLWKIVSSDSTKLGTVKRLYNEVKFLGPPKSFVIQVSLRCKGRALHRSQLKRARIIPSSYRSLLCRGFACKGVRQYYGLLSDSRSPKRLTLLLCPDTVQDALLEVYCGVSQLF